MVATAPARRTGLAGLLAALAMFGPFCIDAIFPAFPAIAAQFDASPLAMQQTISVYLAAYALTSLLHGPLSDSFGRRPVILCGVVVFLFATIGCALADSIGVLLAFRALQGVSAGVGLIVGRAIVRDCFEGAQAQKLMSQISMIFGVAPALAPVIGAWMLGVGGWRGIFWLKAGFAAVLLGVCAAMLMETHPRERRVAFAPRPLFAGYREIVTDAQFLPLALTLTANFGALFLYIASAPAFVLGILRLNQQQFPWLFVPLISGLVFGAMLSGRLAGRVSARILLGWGYAIMLTAAALNIAAALIVQPARVPWTVLPLALGAVGLNLTAPTINLLVLDRFPRHRGGASSVQAFFTLTFNALLAGALASWLAASALRLASASATLSFIGFIAWRYYRFVAKRSPPMGSIERQLLSDAKPG